MLENLDKKKITIITIIAIVFVIIFFMIVSALSGSKKSNNKLSEVTLKATLTEEDVLKFEVETEEKSNVNYVIEKSNTLNFSKAEKVEGSENTPQVEVETKDIEDTAYYRVKMENTKTETVTYSNVISISKKGEKADINTDESDNTLVGSIDGKEIEIKERTGDEDSSKSSSSKSESSKSSTSSETSESSSSQSKYSLNVGGSSSSSLESSSSSKYSYSSSSKSSSSKSSSSKKSSSSYKSSTSSKSSKYSSSLKSSSSSSSSVISSMVSSSSSSKSSSSSSSQSTLEVIDRANIIAVKSIKLSATNVELDISGKNTKALTVTIDPEDATEQEVTWTTDDENIATVDENGTITAVGNGSTNIVAQVGTKKAKCKVKVITSPIGIELDNRELLLDITTNKTVKLEAKVLPETATTTKVTWSSEDTKIAKVDSTGKVTAVANGTTKIIAKVGTLTTECNVTVETTPSSITINSKSVELDVNQHTQEKLETKIVPETATYNQVVWNSSNTKVATVDSTGKITAEGAGMATITASINGKEEIKTEAQVVVSSTISDVTFNRKSINMSLLNGSATTKITANLPNGETYKKATWKSSNGEVATVEGDGLTGIITAKAEGTAAITITVDGKSAICQVTVKRGNLSISKTNNDTLIVDGENTTQIIINNNNVNYAKFTSSDPSVASVDIDGLVTGRKGGNATITVETNEGIGSCEVNVWYETGYHKKIYRYQNEMGNIETVKCFIYVPEEKYVNLQEGVDMIMYFPGEEEASQDWEQADTLGGICEIAKELDGAYSSKKSEFNSLIVGIHGTELENQVEAIDSLTKRLVDTYGVNKKKINLVGYSYGTMQAWKMAALASVDNYTNLQFSSITSIDTLADENEEFNWLKTAIVAIKTNKVNQVPVYIVTSSEDGDANKRKKLQSVAYVDMGTTNKLANYQIGLYSSKNNDVEFSSRFYILKNTTHEDAAISAFTTTNSAFNLIKWIKMQERTTIY